MVLSSCRTVSRITGGEKNRRGGHKEVEKQAGCKRVIEMRMNRPRKEEEYSEVGHKKGNQTAKSEDYHLSNEILTSGLFIMFKHNSGRFSRLVFSLEQVGPSQTSLTEIGEVWGSSVEKSLSVCVCLCLCELSKWDTRQSLCVVSSPVAAEGGRWLEWQVEERKGSREGCTARAQ